MMYDLICLVDNSKESLERFKEIKKINFLAKKLVTNKLLAESILDAAKLSLSKTFFILDHGYSILPDIDYSSIDEHDANSYLILFKSQNNIHEGLVLCNKDLIQSQATSIFNYETKQYDLIGCKKEKQNFDVIFISYNEPITEKNWEILKSVKPDAKRANGIKGIFEAHKFASMLSSTHFFFVVDADSEVLLSFDFDIDFKPFNETKTFVWNAINSVNGLVYGNGGIKLFNKTLFEYPSLSYVDMTLALGGSKIEFMDKLASITIFDSDPFHAFKGAFRECAKLARAALASEEAKDRLETWLTTFAGPYAKEVKLGAELGMKYSNNHQGISNINDVDWLKEQYENAIRI